MKGKKGRGVEERKEVGDVKKTERQKGRKKRKAEKDALPHENVRERVRESEREKGWRNHKRILSKKVRKEEMFFSFSFFTISLKTTTVN